jgi:hypothetical protein
LAGKPEFKRQLGRFKGGILWEENNKAELKGGETWTGFKRVRL